MRRGRPRLGAQRGSAAIDVPPRVRGVASVNLPGAQGTGLTPAGAGSGVSWLGCLPFSRAYPRGCGEWVIHQRRSNYLYGLPPRVRGVDNSSASRMRQLALTPAGAGSGLCQTMSRSISRAYPRGCGEWQKPGVFRCVRNGLPPRVRGVVQGPVDCASNDGLTPAGAGSGHRNWSGSIGYWAYPRGCGEWHRGDVPQNFFAGLTPAGAGSGKTAPRAEQACPAYPRGCGEWSYQPASASRSSAYPRGCGEWGNCAARALTSMGLPPRVRGVARRR